MNNAPFYVGQKVVAVMNGENEFGQKIVRGVEYVIKKMYRCPCGKWSVDVGLSVHNGKHSCTSLSCSRQLKKDSVWVCCKFFAPIEPRSISIPESLKEQAEELISVKETIQEPEKEMV